MFVILDDVQFEKQSWQHRNRIKGPEGEMLLSVPVARTGLDTQIKDAMINTSSWQKKHLQSIVQCYAKAPYLEKYNDWLEGIYRRQLWTSLSKLNTTIIKDIAHHLELKTPIVFSSTLAVEGSKVERLLRICKELKADTYLSPVGSFGYIEEDNRFADHGITLEYQHFEHPSYAQLHGAFLSHLSTVDLLLNEGKKSIEILRSGQHPAYTHAQVAALPK
jgi:hypothetical protein